MTRLSETLDQTTTVLNDLKTVIDVGQQQLSAGHTSGSQLQHITEEKSPLLTTLDYLEQQRRLEHDTTCSVNDKIVGRRQTITKKTQHLYDLNQHNGQPLEEQVEHNQQTIQVLRPYQEPALYDTNGQISIVYHGGKEFSIRCQPDDALLIEPTPFVDRMRRCAAIWH